MKKLIILISLLFIGCTTTKYTIYKVSTENFYTREKTYMKTIDVNDAMYLYESLTGFKLDTTRIAPYYDEKTVRYYFYVEKKERR